MIQYMRPLEDSVRIALLFGCPLGYPLWILYGCPLYSPSRMPLEDSVRVTPLFGPSDASLEDSNRMPIYSDTPYSNAPRVARVLYISAATPHAWKSWILFA